MAGLKLEGINKIYPNGYHAVKDANFEIEDKEFIVLVGPSGCGKSTTLRMIAGLEEISDGELYIGDKVVNDVHPKDRDIAMVFQNYALYPHMSVYDNMAFGLKLRKYSKQDIDERVNNAARILGIEDLLPRKPKQLSGGQRQRVALGRAIVREPKVFLMDEPLSNLDAKLRVQMRAELSKLHKELKTTFVYVTHDQTEAMTMGSRIVVMKDGVVQQIDDPQTIYEHPANRFIASFIGSPQMNFLDCKISKNSDKIYVDFFDNKINIPEEKIKLIKESNYVGKEILLGIRPESVLIDESNEGIVAKVEVTEMLGSETYLYLNANGYNVIARVDPSVKASVGDNVRIKFITDKIHIFDRESEKAIF
ncbi:ABC transporter ATP-binding protein [Oceanirhabdus sp. W0125-5]|uniref:ABC transporter ATP-binding protein n=1 Tax=Oceanirhabdus sp. W0125-5 TaxID=2999116 RepID=UPI0022F2AF39|nr:sn-glycerol-3-phosphate ABC transporter ATP-binding protein UgpC [Oceanirhabdus sp. W0125-5]WBW96778.1 sn-glycerol-3-phosphate ABC transporter ATP-binding protein UgpC [Oceanirhabdus sp. W0125-5]